MKLITSVLTVLIFVNAVYSAAMREGSEDLLRFLNDAFQINLPPDNLEPTQITEAALETEKMLYPTDPTAEFFNTTPKPAEKTGIAEERSTESSNLDSGLTERTSAEDSRDVESYKRLQLKVTDAQKTLQEQYTNSEASASIDTTDMDTAVMKDTNKHPSKATAMTDVSSQEMDKHVDSVRYRSLKTIENYSAEMTGVPERQKLDFMKETHPIIQSLVGRTNLKDQSGQPHETDKHQQKTYKRTVDFDSPEILDADSEELGGGRVPRRMISDQSTIKTTLLSNNQTNRTVGDKNPNVIKTTTGF